MNHSVTALFFIPLALYFAAALLYLLHMLGKKELAGKAVFWLLGSGLGLHLLNLALQVTASPGELPLKNLSQALSFTAWCLVAIAVVTEQRWKMPALGAFALPLALMAMIGSLLATYHQTGLLPQNISQAWLGTHVILTISGYAAFMLAFCAALVYLLQDRFLKSKRLMGLSRRLPPVQTADEAAYRLAALGFPVFTLGLVVGVIWAYATQAKGWALDPKVIWSLVTWVVFVTYLHVRMANGWKGRKAALVLVVGFVCIIITYLLISPVQSGWHRFV